MSLASLAGLYLIRLLGAALHAAGLSAVALSTAGTLRWRGCVCWTATSAA